MPILAYPPHPFTRVSRDPLRRQRRILCRVPLPGKYGVYCLKAVVAIDLLTSTVVASSSNIPLVYGGFPLMAFTAHPPDSLPGSWGNIPWRQRRVLRRMPLPGKLRVCLI